jgi:hypothetical protein
MVAMSSRMTWCSGMYAGDDIGAIIVWPPHELMIKLSSIIEQNFE